ncbi:hypothetical protein BH11PLA1_BH11PLA1_05580 [soil metagenome]
MVKADGSSREFPLDRAATVIGRDEAARLRVPVPQVSRRHCEVLAAGAKVSITDLGSANGTYVNGRKVREADLQPGDLITVGPVVFVVRVNNEPAKIDAKDCFAAGTVGLEDDDDDDLIAPRATPPSTMLSGPRGGAKPGDAPRPAAPAAPAKPTEGGGAKPPISKSVLDDDDDDGGSVSDLLKDFKFDDDDDDDDAPAKK